MGYHVHKFSLSKRIKVRKRWKDTNTNAQWVRFHCYDPDCKNTKDNLVSVVKQRLVRSNKPIFCSKDCQQKFYAKQKPLVSKSIFSINKDFEAQASLDVGKIGEHIATAVLLAQGYTAFLSDQGLPYDIIVEHKNTLIRIQVKTTVNCRVLPGRTNKTYGYLWHVKRNGYKNKRIYKEDAFDLYCFVALDGPYCAFIPKHLCSSSVVNLFPPNLSGHVNPLRIKADITQYSFKKALVNLHA